MSHGNGGRGRGAWFPRILRRSRRCPMSRPRRRCIRSCWRDPGGVPAVRRLGVHAGRRCPRSSRTVTYLSGGAVACVPGDLLGSGFGVMVSPPGGDLGGWRSLPDSPGLAWPTSALAGTSTSPSTTPDRRPGSTRSLRPPDGRSPARRSGCWQTEPPRWAKKHPTVLDLGRLEPSSPALPLLAFADVVPVVAGGDALSLLRLSVAEIPSDRARLVTVGPVGYSMEDLAHPVGGGLRLGSASA